jgi:hypothetical protein
MRSNVEAPTESGRPGLVLPGSGRLPHPGAAGAEAAEEPGGGQRPVLVGGRYQLQQEIGRGASGTVHRAQDRRLPRTVAVKLFTATGDPAEELRAEREAETLAKLDHRGLVRVLDCGSDNGNRYVVLDYVDAHPLNQLIDGAPLSMQESVRLVAALADTLAYVHARGVVHRDVKPANILVDRSGRPRLGDFGVARTTGIAEALTATGCIVGTPRYMAPEQVRGEPATGAVDVYALGLVLLECLTGSPEYPGNGIECAVARLYRPPAIPDRLPAELAAVLTGMTAGNPLHRPTADRAARLLRRIERGSQGDTLPGRPATPGLPSPAGPRWPLPPAPAPAPFPSRGWRPVAGQVRGRRRTLVAAAALALLVGGAVGAWGNHGSDEAPAAAPLTGTIRVGGPAPASPIAAHPQPSRTAGTGAASVPAAFVPLPPGQGHDGGGGDGAGLRQGRGAGHGPGAGSPGGDGAKGHGHGPDGQGG